MRGGGKTWLGALLVGACLSLPSAWGEDAGKKPEKAPRPMPTPASTLPKADTINERVGGTLTDEQKKQIEDLREAIKKKFDELHEKDEVKQAAAKLKEAEAALKAAHDKVKEAMGGFDPREEFQQGLTKVLSAEQNAKLAPAHPAKKVGKKDEPK